MNVRCKIVRCSRDGHKKKRLNFPIELDELRYSML